MPGPNLTKTQKKTALAIVNVLETGRVQGDYAKVTLLPDDSGHLTYGRSQTTLGSGNLALLIRAYCDAEGQLGDDLAPFLAALDARDVRLDHDLRLWDLLRRAGHDPIMRDVQDAFFERVYFVPAMRSAAALHLERTLSAAVVYDGFIHGSFARLRDRVLSASGAPDEAGRFTGDAVDGDFGPKTDLAVRQFQDRSGLKIDGKVGPATRAAMGL